MRGARRARLAAHRQILTTYSTGGQVEARRDGAVRHLGKFRNERVVPLALGRQRKSLWRLQTCTPIGRRELLVALGGAAAWPLAARAQQPMALVGLLTGVDLDDQRIGEIRQSLKDTGYVEGRNVAIKYRSAGGRLDRLPALAAELVADPVSVILTAAPPAALAAKAATGTIPIIFVTGADPVDLGLVSSFNRPGGNVTGISFVVHPLATKRLELLRELVPNARLVGFLVNPANPTSHSQIEDIQAAAHALGVELLVRDASSEREIEAAFASFAQQRVNAVILHGDAFFGSRGDQLIELAALHAMPTMYYLREFVMAGGLISYGASIADAYRLAGIYAGRILKGEKPTDLPVQQSAKFELVVNLKTAKALGLTVPLTLQASADEVIE